MKFFQKYSRKSKSVEKIADIAPNGDVKRNRRDVVNGNSRLMTSSLELLPAHDVTDKAVTNTLDTYANGEVKSQLDDEEFLESSDQFQENGGCANGGAKSKKKSRGLGLVRLRLASKSSKARDSRKKRDSFEVIEEWINTSTSNDDAAVDVRADQHGDEKLPKHIEDALCSSLKSALSLSHGRDDARETLGSAHNDSADVSAGISMMSSDMCANSHNRDIGSNVNCGAFGNGLREISDGVASTNHEPLLHVSDDITSACKLNSARGALSAKSHVLNVCFNDDNVTHGDSLNQFVAHSRTANGDILLDRQEARFADDVKTSSRDVTGSRTMKRMDSFETLEEWCNLTLPTAESLERFEKFLDLNTGEFKSDPTEPVACNNAIDEPRYRTDTGSVGKLPVNGTPDKKVLDCEFSNISGSVQHVDTFSGNGSSDAGAGEPNACMRAPVKALFQPAERKTIHDELQIDTESDAAPSQISQQNGGAECCAHEDDAMAVDVSSYKDRVRDSRNIKDLRLDLQTVVTSTPPPSHVVTSDGIVFYEPNFVLSPQVHVTTPDEPPSALATTDESRSSSCSSRSRDSPASRSRDSPAPYTLSPDSCWDHCAGGDALPGPVFREPNFCRSPLPTPVHSRSTSPRARSPTMFRHNSDSASSLSRQSSLSPTAITSSRSASRASSVTSDTSHTTGTSRQSTKFRGHDVHEKSSALPLPYSPRLRIDSNSSRCSSPRFASSVSSSPRYSASSESGSLDSGAVSMASSDLERNDRRDDGRTVSAAARGVNKLRKTVSNAVLPGRNSPATSRLPKNSPSTSRLPVTRPRPKDDMDVNSQRYIVSYDLNGRRVLLPSPSVAAEEGQGQAGESNSLLRTPKSRLKTGSVSVLDYLFVFVCDFLVSVHDRVLLVQTSKYAYVSSCKNVKFHGATSYILCECSAGCYRLFRSSSLRLNRVTESPNAKSSPSPKIFRSGTPRWASYSNAIGFPARKIT